MVSKFEFCLKKCVFLDSRHYDRRDGQPRDAFCQGCAPVVVSNEDGRLPQRQHSKLYDVVARRFGIQRHHPQALPRTGSVRQTVEIERHVQPQQRLQRG